MPLLIVNRLKGERDIQREREREGGGTEEVQLYYIFNSLS